MITIETIVYWHNKNSADIFVEKKGDEMFERDEKESGRKILV